MTESRGLHRSIAPKVQNHRDTSWCVSARRVVRGHPALELAQAETKGGGRIAKIGTAGPPARDGAVATGDMIIVR